MISYIIATYAGKRHTSNKQLASSVLHLQITNLIEWVKQKKHKPLITEIIIVCPSIKKDDEALPNYYRFHEWSSMCSKYGITLRQLMYSGKNEHYSYDQWIQGWLVADPSSQYYILIEDDYTLSLDNIDADTDLIECYTRLFPDGLGYLCTMTADAGLGYHAAISNGMISRYTARILGASAISYFYNLTTSPFAQVNFSFLFTENGIPLYDYRDTHQAWFWNSRTDELEDYSIFGKSKENKKHIFIPVQMLMF